MEQREYSYELPTQPPDGVIPWLREQGHLNRHALIYKAAWVADPLSGEKERMVRLKCSACGDEMYAARADGGCCAGRYGNAPFGYIDPVYGEGVISGQAALCPMCGAKVKVCHVGGYRDWIPLEEKYPMTVARVDDRLVLMGWCIREWCSMDGEEQLSAFPYEAYVVEEKKVVRLMGYHKCMYQIHLMNHWEQRKTCLDNWGEAPLVYPWDPALLNGSTAENCKLDLYMKTKEPRPVTYLRLWQRRRNVENLITMGCGELLNSMMAAETQGYYYSRPKGVPKLEEINWKERRPSKMLGLTAEELHWCVLMGWNRQELDFFRWAGMQGVRLKLPEEMRLCKEAGINWCNRLVSEKKLPLMRCVRYVLKQRGKNSRADSSILDDYWRMAQREGLDLGDEYNMFPPDLMKAHDRVMAIRKAREAVEAAEKQAAENEKLRAGFAKQLEKLSAYAWVSGGIIIRPAEQPEELVREGDMLHHCVGGYRSKHAEGRSAIFFIRRESAPDEPWYTLELNLKELTVIQNRGKGNSARTEEVRKFEEAWLEHVKAIAKTKKKGKNAA